MESGTGTDFRVFVHRRLSGGAAHKALIQFIRISNSDSRILTAAPESTPLPPADSFIAGISYDAVVVTLILQFPAKKASRRTFSMSQMV